MSTDTPDGGRHTPTEGRHTARKTAARELAARTGMPYAAALRQVTRAATPWQPRHQWIITGDLRDWLDGKTWRGVSYGDLRTWLDDEVRPDYECWWCEEPGDARREPSAIELLVTEYDPDIQPATIHLQGGTHKFHGGCKPLWDASPLGGASPGPREASIAWVRRADIPAVPQPIALPASMKPEVAGEFDLEARAVLMPPFHDEWDDEDRPDRAVLLVTARVTEDHGQGARPWLTELELHLNTQGFAHPDSLARGECDWALRVATGRRPWVALRTGHDDDGAIRHLLLCTLDIPDGWVDAARRDGLVTVAVGPCTAHWDDIDLRGDVADEIEELRDRSVLVSDGDAADGCACAALTAEHLDGLTGLLVTADIPIVEL